MNSGQYCMQIIQPGVLTTIQDRGRFGFMKSGVGTNGAMDQEAYRAANALVGNGEDAAELEMTYSGITAVFLQDTVIALTGAGMDARLDGVSIARYQPVAVSSGQKLVMGTARNGMRAYLAIRGGIDVPVVMGSRSTNLRCRFGGLEGRALKAGDLIPAGIKDAGEERTTRIIMRGEYHSHAGCEIDKEERTAGVRKPASDTGSHPVCWPVPHYSRDITVRVIPGPQADYFTGEGWETFLNSRYSVSDQSDRMGIRLLGPAVTAEHGVDIVSDGIVSGSVQIPRSGMPIVMMADHQTTGGYAKIATVVSFDLPLLAQAVPGSYVSFQRISIEQAQELYLHPDLQRRAEFTIAVFRRRKRRHHQWRITVIRHPER